MMKLAVSSTSGASTVRRELISPRPPLTAVRRALPSFNPMSKTEETRPPNRAGMVPLVISMSLTASALNTLKKPNRWEAL